MHWTLKFVRIYARMLLLENRNLGDSTVDLKSQSLSSTPLPLPFP